MIKKLILIVILLIKNIKTDFDVSGSFVECSVTGNNHQLSIDSNCFMNKGLTFEKPNNDGVDISKIYNAIHIMDRVEEQEYKDTLNKKNTLLPSNYIRYEAFVLSKRDFILEDIGFECKVTLYDYTFSRDILLNTYTELSITHKKLTRNQCLDLVQNKVCFQNKMNCHSNRTCRYKDRMIPQYPTWFGRNKVVYSECEFNEKVVVSDGKAAKVIFNAVEPCSINDGFCQLEQSIVIWDPNTIRKCPYEKMEYLTNLTVADTKTNIIYSYKEKYLFQLINKKYSKECKFDLFSTTEGKFELNFIYIHTIYMIISLFNPNLKEFILCSLKEIQFFTNKF